MQSAFQSCEFGYGMLLTPDQLCQVNAARLGKKYKDEQAATKKRGTAFKPPLLLSLSSSTAHRLKGIGPMTQWSCNLRTVPTLLIPFIHNISFCFFLTTRVAMTEAAMML
jgi:hypothetical protein